MRKLLALVVVAVTFALGTAAPATADPPFVKPLPDAACNDGTQNAATAAGRFNPHVPHFMGFCMTMPGVGQPPPGNP